MFTPVHTLVGGFLLHIASSSLLTGLGRVFGGSGIIDAALFGDRARWRWALLGGMLGAPLLNRLTALERMWDLHYLVGAKEPVEAVAQSAVGMVVAGLLVGAGSKLGSGCTSGHFLCGFSRFSPRSIVATFTFFATAVVTALITSGPVNLGSNVTASYTAVYPSKSEWIGLLALPVALYTASSWLTAATRPHKDDPAAPAAASIGSTLPLALLTGYTFSTGLQLSGMASPLKVLRFLHLPIPGVFDAREWDPSLLFVVLGGIIPNAIHFATHVKPDLARPDAAKRYFVPTGQAARTIDAKLIGGAAMFGVGWGMTGLCLLPSVVALGRLLSGDTTIEATGLALFAAATIAGMRGVRALGA